MFLTASPFWDKVEGGVWYKNSPVGVNEISKWVKSSADRIGLDVKRRKISNHSIRSSAVTSLAKSGVGEQQIMKITGHNNINSIKSYLQLDGEHHQAIINQMRGKITTATSNVLCTASTSVSSSSADNVVLPTDFTSSKETALQGLLQNCSNVNFSNCSFNFYSK